MQMWIKCVPCNRFPTTQKIYKPTKTHHLFISQLHCGNFSTGFLDMWTPNPQTQHTNRKTKRNCFQNKHFPFSKKYIVGISWQFFYADLFFCSTNLITIPWEAFDANTSVAFYVLPVSFTFASCPQRLKAITRKKNYSQRVFCQKLNEFGTLETISVLLQNMKNSSQKSRFWTLPHRSWHCEFCLQYWK